MPKQGHCGGETRPGPKTVKIDGYRRSTPGDHCHGHEKPGPKNVTVKPHKRSKP